MTEEVETTVSEKPFQTEQKKFIAFRDVAQVLLVILLWAICYPLITTGLASSPPLHFAVMRSLLAGVCLLVIGIIVKRPLFPKRDTWFDLVVASFTFTTLGFIGMFLAGGKVSPGLATVITNVQPLFAAVLGFFILAERLVGVRGLALLIGFVGVAVVAIPGFLEQSSNSTPSGVGLVLLGAIGVAIGNVWLKRIAHRVDPLIAMGWILLIGAVPLVLAAGIFEQTETIRWDASFLWTLIVLSILGTSLAFVLWLDVLRRAELNLINAYTFLTPIFALIIGALFYGERLSLIEWIGVGIIVFSVMLTSWTNGNGKIS